MENKDSVSRDEFNQFKKSIEGRIRRMEDDYRRDAQVWNEFMRHSSGIPDILEVIKQSVERLEQSTIKSLDLLKEQIEGIQKNQDETQKQELQNYLMYKKIIIGCVLTAIVGALMGAVLTSFRIFGG